MTRPKRAAGAKPERDPLQQAVAELAARVKWLEECQRVNVETVEALRAQLVNRAYEKYAEVSAKAWSMAMDQLVRMSEPTLADTAAAKTTADQLAESAMSAVDFSVPDAGDWSFLSPPRRTRLGPVARGLRWLARRFDGRYEVPYARRPRSEDFRAPRP